MGRNIVSTTALLALFALSLAASASAQVVLLSATNRGFYDNSGNKSFQSATANYSAGDARGLPPAPLVSNDIRNFFVFDLSGVTQSIASAQLELYMPGPPMPPGWINSTSSGSEGYELHDVVTPIANLLDGTGGVANHADLGSGVVYGSRTITPDDMGTVVIIPLNAASIAALDAATGLFGFGGSVTTLDGTASTELVFTNTGSQLPIETTQLRLTVVPEPSTLLLGLAGIFFLPMRGNRKHS
jgi:hypothetical protein